MQVEPSWYLVGNITNEPHIITVYGLKDETTARRIAETIRPLCSKVLMTKTWKVSKFSPWIRKETVV